MQDIFVSYFPARSRDCTAENIILGCLFHDLSRDLKLARYEQIFTFQVQYQQRKNAELRELLQDEQINLQELAQSYSQGTPEWLCVNNALAELKAALS